MEAARRTSSRIESHVHARTVNTQGTRDKTHGDRHSRPRHARTARAAAAERAAVTETAAAVAAGTQGAPNRASRPGRRPLFMVKPHKPTPKPALGERQPHA